MNSIKDASQKVTCEKMLDILTTMAGMEQQVAESILANVQGQDDNLPTLGFVTVTGEHVWYEHDFTDGGYWVGLLTGIEDCEVHHGLMISRCKIDGHRVYLVRSLLNDNDFSVEMTMFQARLTVERMIDAAYDRAAY